MSSRRYPCQISAKLEFSRQILEKYLYFMKIRPLLYELFHTDRRTDVTNLIVAFRNFSNKAYKNISQLRVNNSVSSIKANPYKSVGK
jgi:hypothetical protein